MPWVGRLWERPRAATAAVLLAIVMLLPGCGRERKPLNVALVVLDTVRQDATGLVAADSLWRGLTPQLDRLAAGAAVFPNAWACAPWTVPSHASFFTGLLPSGHHCTFKRPRLGNTGPTCAELLAQSGYETAAFFSNPWLGDDVSGLLRGFAVRKKTPIGELNNLISAEGDQGGRGILGDIAGWLETRRGDRPFFLFVNFLEAHLPYNPPADYRQECLSDLPQNVQVSIRFGHEFNAGLHSETAVDWSVVRRLYGGDVSTADRLLTSLIGLLRKHGVYDETVLIVTSDHGENLGDHGLMEHQFSVHETLLRVPLVIRAPEEILRPGVREEPVLLTDLFATVLDVAGVLPENPLPQSHSLLAAPAAGSEKRALIAEYAGPSCGLLELLVHLNPEIDSRARASALRTVRVGDLRLTVSGDGLLLHDLAADPRQETNLASKRPEAVRWLAGILADLPESGWADSTQEIGLDEATRRELESLGYIR